MITLCPDNLIKVGEIPEYAGLIYVNEHGGVKIVKQAPLVHKGRLEYHERLCSKLYYGYKESRVLKNEDKYKELKREIRDLNKDKENLLKRIKDLSNFNKK